MSEQETKQSIASKITSVPVANVSGNTAITGTLGVSGITTLQSAVTLQAGVTIAGNIAVNTDRFNVTATNGNTAIAGSLVVAGKATLGTLNLSEVSAYASNAAAVTGGLVVGDIYVNSSTYALTIVHA